MHFVMYGFAIGGEDDVAVAGVTDICSITEIIGVGFITEVAVEISIDTHFTSFQFEDLAFLPLPPVLIPPLTGCPCLRCLGILLGVFLFMSLSFYLIRNRHHYY